MFLGLLKYYAKSSAKELPVTKILLGMFVPKIQSYHDRNKPR